MKIFVNDDLIEDIDAGIGVFDLGLNRAFAVFDYFKIVAGKFRFFEDHLNRFLNSVHLSNIPMPYSRAQVKEKIIHLKDINKIENGFVRITLTAGDSDNFARLSSQSNLIIVVGKPLSIENSDLKPGVNLISKHYQRSIPLIKTTDYFFAQMHRSEMLEANAADILYYTDSITETSRANIFFIKNDTLFTPEKNILQGITRKKVLSLYQDTVVGDISMAQVSKFDEAFICSSTREITPVLKIDENFIGLGKTGPKTFEIMHRFRQIAR